MTGLLSSELLRLRSRRLYKWLLGLSLLGLLIGGLVALARADNTAPYVTMHSNLENVGFPMVMLSWLIGASSIGAEWGPRTLSALLTWEPRRIRVVVAKLGALAVFVVGVVLLLAGFFAAVMAPASAVRGSFDGVDASWVADYLVIAARVAFVAVMASFIGFGLATIGKNTGAALGGGFVYLFVAEPMLQAWKPGLMEWLLGWNMGRVVIAADEFDRLGRSSVGAAAIVLLWAAVIVAIAAWLFRRREIA